METPGFAFPCMGAQSHHALFPSPMEAETRELFLEQEQLHNK